MSETQIFNGRFGSGFKDGNGRIVAALVPAEVVSIRDLSLVSETQRSTIGRYFFVIEEG